MIEILPNFHPILVHFTIALLFVSFFAFLVSIWGNNYTVRYQARLIGRWNLWIGAAMSVLTVAAGVYAFNTVAHDDASHVVMEKHEHLALATFALYGILAIWSLMHFRKDKDEPKSFVLIVFAAVVMVLVTAWYGGELVYRHGLGVMSLPVPEGAGHDHGDGHSHSSENGDTMSEAGDTGGHNHNDTGDGHTHEHSDEAGDGHDHVHDQEGQ